MSEPANTPASGQEAALATDLRVLAGKLKRRLREQGSAGDLTGSQVAVLSRLERDGPATVAELARAEAMRPQSMGAVTAVLEAAGHIQGRPDPADGRRTILSLTEACRAWIHATRAAREDWLLRVIRTELSPPEQEELARALVLLRRIVDS